MVMSGVEESAGDGQQQPVTGCKEARWASWLSASSLALSFLHGPWLSASGLLEGGFCPPSMDSALSLAVCCFVVSCCGLVEWLFFFPVHFTAAHIGSSCVDHLAFAAVLQGTVLDVFPIFTEAHGHCHEAGLECSDWWSAHTGVRRSTARLHCLD